MSDTAVAPRGLVPGEHIICGRCRLPVGAFPDPDGHIVSATYCDCDRLPAFTIDPLPDRDPIRTWEHRQTAAGVHQLCSICATRWIPEANRYALRMCGSCHWPAMQLNALLGTPCIPIGNHGLNNVVRPVVLQRRPVFPRVHQAAQVLTDALPDREDRQGHSRGDHRLRFTFELARLHMASEIERILSALQTTQGLQLPDGEDMPIQDYVRVASVVRDGSTAALLRAARLIADATPGRVGDR